ncbi:transposase [Chryseobacterium lactis]|uniref:Transposase n=2 Tax=Chryseobacterium lactis TaxID=1241981 RepID=A0A3G6RNE8_CHRLC|nr:transposase [Chryseobacterium lactis]AZB04537.1 transposase [Chryseobacterium lactis]PNW12706.1 transposase [Chryseobacterium lactis]
MLDLKNIHVGSLVKLCIEERKINEVRICKFLKCSGKELESIFLQKSLEAEVLLKLSILLEYDFFRIYSQYLILYAPQKGMKYNHSGNEKTILPKYRKNIYTKEVVDFILEQIESGKKTKAEVIKEYRIPKTTLYKWQNKYVQLKNSMK